MQWGMIPRFDRPVCDYSTLLCACAPIALSSRPPASRTVQAVYEAPQGALDHPRVVPGKQIGDPAALLVLEAPGRAPAQLVAVPQLCLAGPQLFGGIECQEDVSVAQRFGAGPRASATIATLLAQFEGDDKRWSAQLHASPRLPRLGSRSGGKYV